MAARCSAKLRELEALRAQRQGLAQARDAYMAQTDDNLALALNRRAFVARLDAAIAGLDERAAAAQEELARLRAEWSEQRGKAEGYLDLERRDRAERQARLDRREAQALDELASARSAARAVSGERGDTRG